MIVEFLQIQIPTDRTSGTRTRATQMLTNTIVEICSTTLTTAPRRDYLKFSIIEKVERVQYQAALAITGAWQGSSHSKIYDELGNFI